MRPKRAGIPRRRTGTTYPGYTTPSRRLRMSHREDPVGATVCATPAVAPTRADANGHPRLRDGSPPPRILVADDDDAIRADFAKVLRAHASVGNDLAALEAELFGVTAPLAPASSYELEFASNSAQALHLAQAAMAANRPYVLAFIDVRMPPGADGVATTGKLWEIDPTLHVVLCTAHSDYAWQDIQRTLGHPDRLLVLKKPFEPIEVRQLASALVAKARLARAQGQHVAELELRVRERTTDLEQANVALRTEMAARQAAQQDLLRAQRLQALGQLTAGIAHEINNPLAYVQANLEFVREQARANTAGSFASPDDEVRQALDEAIAGADRIKRIVRDIRSFAGHENDEPQRMPPQEAVERARALLGATLARRATVTCTYDSTSAVAAGPVRLTQVIVNLLRNAQQAFSSDDPANNHIAIRVRDEAGLEVLIEVTDNGCGIAAADLPRIFDPFFTTREVGEGTGLGLSVVHGIVTSLGGTVQIDSQPERGTRASVRLPSTREDAPDRGGGDAP